MKKRQGKKKKAVGRKVRGVVKYPQLKETGKTLQEHAVELARKRGSTHYVDDSGKPTEPLAKSEFSTGSQAVIAADIERVIGKRIIVRMDDPDNEVGGLKMSDAHLKRKCTGTVVAVSPELAGEFEKGDKVLWAGARAGDFPAIAPGWDCLVCLRVPEEVISVYRETVRVRRSDGTAKETREQLLREAEGTDEAEG